MDAVILNQIHIAIKGKGMAATQAAAWLLKASGQEKNLLTDLGQQIIIIDDVRDED